MLPLNLLKTIYFQENNFIVSNTLLFWAAKLTKPTQLYNRVCSNPIVSEYILISRFTQETKQSVYNSYIILLEQRDKTFFIVQGNNQNNKMTFAHKH